MDPRLVEQQVENAARPVVEEMGLELVAVEIAAEPAGTVLRIMVDRPGGIDLDGLTQATRALDPVLNLDISVKGRYRLEISSPGIERPLRRREDFERYTGKRAHVRTAEKIAGRRNFRGTIESVEGDHVTLRTDEERFRVPLDAVTKAHLIVEI